MNRLARTLATTLALPLFSALAAPAAQAQEPTVFKVQAQLSTGGASSSGFSAGLQAGEANADDVGLPVYPGAVPQRDKADDGAAVKLDLWGGRFGFQLAVLKLASRDSVDTVASFYRQALAKHGEVVDCSAGAPPRTEPPAADKTALRCDGEDRRAGQRVYKVGTRAQFRLVALQPAPGGAGGTHFQLLRIRAPS